MTLRRLLFVVVFILAFPYDASAIEWLKYFTFSEKGVLRIWKEKLHQGKVDYKVIHEPITGDHIRGVANAAASGLYYEIKNNPKEMPYLSWK